MARVWVAMSGGVDSSVAAALLVEQGHEVSGVTMHLLSPSDDEDVCCGSVAASDAQRVCDLLGIAHHVLDYRQVFRSQVIESFARDYASGLTPNPCVSCNDRIKFSCLLAEVSLQGAEFLATGHYAQVVETPDGRRLARGLDAGKDQSYFLHNLTPLQLDRVMFPLGALTKSEVRALAERMGLPTADRPESQDICFVTEGDRSDLVAQYCPGALLPGDIVDTQGRCVGRHSGIAHYTVGQRKGLGVGGQPEPVFVTAIDPLRNIVVVGRKSDLSARRVECESFVWHGDSDGGSTPMPCVAMVRYRMTPAEATASVVRDSAGGERLVVEFAEPVSGVAPGQSVVCYGGDVVLGGGVITCAS